ncbi:hypothetical protein [Zobellia nedashkovskayae]|uniref:hypothetical protein n=1 Tax=Zobellia nedashkovskayae TaxID=2779510 RepID=UPI00188BA493|nr:hypothetical protein [Zobellia nedashkovskayae]
MLTDKLKKYLEENADSALPEFQEKIKNVFKNKLGLTEKINGSFLEFMIKYSDEYYGRYSYIMDVANDILDIDTSYTKSLWNNFNVPQNYISLYNGELDDYLLYDKETDMVVLIEEGNDIKLKTKTFDKKWDSFNEFLEDFFKLS